MNEQRFILMLAGKEFHRRHLCEFYFELIELWVQRWSWCCAQLDDVIKGKAIFAFGMTSFGDYGHSVFNTQFFSECCMAQRLRCPDGRPYVSY